MNRLPEIEDHTRAKHAILKRYLDAWFPILGKDRERINYLDGFAGSAEYEGGEPGSPLVAIRAARAHLDKGTLSNNTSVNFIFINDKKCHHEHLGAVLERETIPPSFQITRLQGAFDTTLASVLDTMDNSGQRLAPTFAFVDPFGFSGIPMELMGRLLSYPRCEVFINVMIDFINRFVEHPSDQITNHIEATFGIEDIAEQMTGQHDRKSFLLDAYEGQLQKHARFVNRFDMINRRNNHLYSLYFASSNPLGFRKMKEAYWSVDQNRGGLFSDADPRGSDLFDLFGTIELQQQLIEHFGGKVVKMFKVEDWVIEKTRYLPKHLRERLRTMEGPWIDVIEEPGKKRRKGTYPRDSVSIRFHKSKQVT